MGTYFRRSLKKPKSKSKLPLIIGAAVGGIVLLVLIIVVIASLTKKTPEDTTPSYKINPEITFQLNDKLPEKKDFFLEYKNMNDDDVEIDYTQFNMTVKQDYNVPVTVTIDGKKDEYIVLVKVTDTKAPELKLKELTIRQGSIYFLDEFIESCKDTGSGECYYSYSDPSFGNITEVGTHQISIKAVDSYGNEAIVVTKLTITAPSNSGNTNPSPKPTCKYGSLTVASQSNNPIAYYVSKDNNNCPIDASKYDLSADPNSVISQKVSSIYSADLERLKDEIKNINSTNTCLIPEAVKNLEGTGIVGYRIEIIVFENPDNATIDCRDKDNPTLIKNAKEIYYIKEDGTRYYIKNAYNLK